MKKWKHSLTALALAAAMLFSLAACTDSAGTQSQALESAPAGGSDSEVSTDPGSGIGSIPSNTLDENGLRVLRVGSSSTFATMYPFSVYTVRGEADKVLYEPLAMRNGFGGELKGVLAKSWEKTGDRTYSIEIYDYIYDTAGNHITAADVAFSVEGAMSEGNFATLVVESVTQTGDYTVDLVLNTDSVGSFERACDVAIVSKAAFEASQDQFATTPIGTSQYVVTDYVPGAYIEFTKTNNYWQTDPDLLGPSALATVDKLTFVTITEASQMSIALEAGTVDAISNIEVSALEDFDEGGKYANDFVEYGVPDTGTQVVYFSGDETSLVHDDVNLRKAIAHAINFEDVLLGAYQGRGEVVEAFGSNLFSDCPTVSQGNYFPYDPDLAKEYLANSNYDGQSKIRLLCTAGTDDRVAEIMMAYLNAVGIQVEIMAYDTALVHSYSRDPSKFDMYVTFGQANDYTITWWSTYLTRINNNGVCTRHGWVDDDLEAAVLLAGSSDENHTVENMNAVQTILNENAYAFAMYYTYTYSVWNVNSGIGSVPLNGVLLEWSCVEWE